MKFPSGSVLGYVASYTGAWIETQVAAEVLIAEFVASYTGAWIETQY